MKKYILILVFVVLFVSMFLMRHHFSIFYFQGDRYRTSVNIETTTKNNDNVFVCFNKNCNTMQFKHNIYSYRLNQKDALFYHDTKGDIEIISYNKDFINTIKNVSIFSKNFKYLKNLHQEEITFQDKKAYSINIISLNNDKSIIKKSAVYFESIFYNWYFYIIFYVLICLYFIKYKPDIKTKGNLPIFLILLLGLFLRLSHINFIPLWNDELYTIYCISEGKLNLLKTLSDPGDPPFFYIISNIWLLFFNKSIYSIRMLPCLIGIFNIYSIYFILNKIFNKKIALTGAFLTAINIFIIMESNEIRSYILSMTLVLWGGYYFYKLYKNFSTKNLIIYFVLSILLINVHYYAVLFVLFNFILGIFIFKRNKKFITLNTIAFLTILPFLINIYKIALSSSFNIWIEKPNLALLNNHIIFYFGNIVFFIIVIVFTYFAIKKFIQKKERNVVLYNILSIFFVFLSAFLFSVLIKPILYERYFCIFLPLLIINTAIFLNTDYKTKYSPLILVLILIFSINIPKYEYYSLYSNLNDLLNYSLADSKNKDYYIIPDNINYIKNFKNIDEKRVIVSKVLRRENEDLLEVYKKEVKTNGATLYLPEICINLKIKYSKNKNIQTIYTTSIPIYKVLLE